MRALYLHRRFFILLWGMFFAAILAFIYPFLFVWVVWVFGLCAFLTVVDVMLLYSFGKAVEAERKLAARFSNGEENPVEIYITNHYPFPIGARVIDEAPVEFQQRCLTLFFKLSVEELGKQTYFLRPVKRGEYRFGQIRMFVTSPLGLVERRYSFGQGCSVAVYPSFIGMRRHEWMAYAGEQRGEGLKKIRVAELASAFDQIKSYVQGDDPRMVNWKATAKCNRLMVNTFTEERSQPVYCLVDKGRTMQSPFLGMTTLDYAINATLAVSKVILKKGDRAGLLTFSEHTATLIKADNRRIQLNRISEALYNQQTRGLETDFEQVYITVSRNLHSRSLLILFTNFDTVEGMKRCLPALKRLAEQHLLLVILFENTEVHQLMVQPAGQIQEVYLKALAGSFLLDKRRIARELCNRGIHTILSQPGELTGKAIRGYLELKSRGLI